MRHGANRSAILCKRGQPLSTAGVDTSRRRVLPSYLSTQRIVYVSFVGYCLAQDQFPGTFCAVVIAPAPILSCKRRWPLSRAGSIRFYVTLVVAAFPTRLVSVAGHYLAQVHTLRRARQSSVLSIVPHCKLSHPLSGAGQLSLRRIIGCERSTSLTPNSEV